MTKLKEFKVGEFRLGPTGQTSDLGAPDSDLEMAVAVDYQHAIIRIVFGDRISWFGVRAEQARALAQQLVEMAELLERRRT